MVDEDGDRINRIEWAALFHGRNPAESVSIAVGPEDVADHLQIQLVDDPQRDLLSDATVTKRLKYIFAINSSHLISCRGDAIRTRENSLATEMSYHRR